jgi:hypothetical protein
MARRLGMVERVALVQNAPRLPFTNERLAASFGKTAAEFDAMPVSKAASNVVFDALVESKSGLLRPDLCDARRAAFFTPDGGLDEVAFRAGLYKSRSLVLVSWLFYGKGRIYGVAVFLKLLIDNLHLKDQLGPAAPYVDVLLLAGAVVAGVVGARTQAEVREATSGYETVSLEDAEAASKATPSEGEYSTVFEKWASGAKAAPSEAGAPQQSDGLPTFVPPLVMVAGILGMNILGKMG